MVLPAPPADDAPREGRWLDEIKLELRLAAKGLLVLVDDARPERLRDLVLALLPEYPQLDVHTDMADVYKVPEGSVMVLAPRAEDADWLNMQRPVFARRELKVILWCDKETTQAIRRNAFDFFDWISHSHTCPPGVPMHGVFGIRAAHRAHAAGICWTGGPLEECFRVALPGVQLVSISARQPYPALLDAVRAAGSAWIVFHDVHDFRTRVVELVLAEANRVSGVIVEDEWGPSGWPRLHGISMSLPEARDTLAQAGAHTPGRLAALAGLEPEAIAIAAQLLGDGRREIDTERILRQADDPGAASARAAGYQPWLRPPNTKPHAVWSPVLRAFSDQPFHARARKDRERKVKDSDHFLWHMQFVASHAALRGSLDEAEPLTDRAVDLAAQVRGTKHPDYADALQSKAVVLSRRGRFEQAKELLERAITIMDNAGKTKESQEMHSDLADVLAHMGQYASAEQVAVRALELAREYKAGRDPLIQQAKSQLARIRKLLARSHGEGSSST